MNKMLFLILVLVGHLSFGQVKPLVKVEGTKFSMVPPDGFLLSSTFPGFEDTENKAVILILEWPMSYKEVSKGLMTNTQFLEGLDIISHEVIKFQGAEATFLMVSEQLHEKTIYRQILFFADDKKTIMLNGAYPEAAKVMEEKIKVALLSTVYTPAK